MTATQTIKLLLFADPASPVYADNTLREMIAANGYNQTVILLATAELRRLADEPTSVTESGGLSVSFQDRTNALQGIIEYAQRVGYQDPEGSAAGTGSVLTGTSAAWEEKEFTP